MPTDSGGCPDDAACHYNCLTGCWRVANDTPLPSSGRATWPASVVTEYGAVVETGPVALPPDTSPDPLPTGEQPQTFGVHDAAAGSGEASPADERGGPTPIGDILERLQESVTTARTRRRRPRAADPEHTVVIPDGIPIVDLTSLVRSLHDTRLDLRDRAKLLRTSASQLEELYHVVLSVAQHLESAASQVEELRTVLRGGR